MVVLQLPTLRNNPRLGQIRKLLHVQQLIPHATVELSSTWVIRRDRRTSRNRAANSRTTSSCSILAFRRLAIVARAP
jgi:hypothetical protein